jgi:hypothetical protein
VQSFSKPCPPECSIGVITSGVRPSRDAASLANSVRPRAPARGEKHRYLALDFSITSAYGEQVRPRGPPVSFS